MQVQGYFDLQFEPVREVFAELFDGGKQRGAALCVQIGGETVLDLWAGQAGRTEDQQWHTDTLVNLFSCTKTFTAVVALQLVAEGHLDLDKPLGHWWPEAANRGKESVTLRQLLCHRAGLSAIRAPLPAAALFDWSSMTHALEQEQPWWVPNTQQGYAPMTYGWWVGELIRRVEGRGVGDVLKTRLVEPLGLDFHLGLPESELSRVAHLTRGRNDFGDAAAQALMKAVQSDPHSLTALSFNNPPGLMNSANSPEWQRAVLPAANGHGNARSLARFYMGLLQGRLLDSALLSEMTREHSQGEDRTLLARTRFGLGCWLDQPIENATFGMGPHCFGHPGAGGCLGFADPERELSFGFVTNTLGPYVLMDPRAQRLARIVKGCLG